MKKIVVALGALLALASIAFVSSAPAGAGDISYAMGHAVTVSGSPVEGATLTADPGAWTPQPTSRRYEWLRDGEDDVLSRDPAYTVSPDDVGHTLVVVERVAFGAEQDDSSYQTPVVGTGIAGPTPTVSGSAKVGRTLHVSLAGGTAGVSTTVQWFRDSAPIPGATGADYTAAKADAGRGITVRATTTPAGLAAVVSASNTVRVPALNAKRPTVKGTTKVGRRLTIGSKGTWYAAGHRYTYRWLRSGKAIPGATKSSYKLTTKDRKKSISVRVYARKSGFPTVSATSKSAAKIR